MNRICQQFARASSKHKSGVALKVILGSSNIHIVRRIKMSQADGSNKHRVDAVCIDLSGTLHIGDTPISGAQTALDRLRNAGLKLVFVTNTTKESKKSLHKRLIKLGFNIEQEEIFTSLTAARNLLLERKLRPKLYLQDNAKEQFKDIKQENPNAVVVGLAPEYFNYTPMNEAFKMLLEGASLIAIHKARYYKDEQGLQIGPGAFVAGLEFATGVQAEVVGKPQAAFFHQALSSINCDPASAVMIGDDVKDDVLGAMQAGMWGILVQTGKYRKDDETKTNPLPTTTCANFTQAVQYILTNMT